MPKDNKTIAITLRFWTNDINPKFLSDENSRAICWDSGTAMIERNRGKGINGMNPLPFNSFEDIIPIIMELFRKSDVYVLSENRRPRVYSPKRRAR